MTHNEYGETNLRYRRMIEKELERIACESAVKVYPKLNEAMFYSVNVGGKRLRPCLMLAVCEMFGGNAEDALPYACGLEMIHTYSLIHDDLPCVDNDDMRRGKPSNHKVFGEGLAVFAGCGLLSLAFENMLSKVVETGEMGQLRAVREIAVRSGAGGMLSGQAADIVNESLTCADMVTLSYIHKHKTADMLEAAVISGAYIAGADEDTIKDLRNYSEKMGLLFQITDDLLDVRGDQTLVGKTLGKDKASGKLTYVGMYGIEGAEKAAEEAAKEAVASIERIPNNGYLVTTVEKMLVRSK